MQPSSDKSTDRRATVVEAAAILGITPDAVRSRLRRGTLRREQGPDGEVLVALDGDQSVDHSPTDRPTVALVEALQDQIDHLCRQLDEANRANAEHRRLLAAALERIPELEPAPEPRESPVTSSEGEEKDNTLERLWWRKLLSG